jgi:small-conductance mechanosensitive channel
MRGQLGRRARGVLIRDWLEISLTVLGLVFLALALLFVVALGVVVASWGEPPPADLPVGRGLFQVNKGAGVAVFSVGTLLFAMVGWSLAGASIRARYRQLRRKQPPPSIPPKPER